jgi:nitronate monooxygenase
VAAGGLATHADVARVRARGAAGAMLGTRFLATAESGAHDAYKAALVAAGAGSTALTVCFDGGWPQASHRVLRTLTLERWEDAGCPARRRRPGDGDVVATRAGTPIARYDDSPPLAGDVGAIEEMCLYAGEGCDAIDDVPAVADLLDRLDPR